MAFQNSLFWLVDKRSVKTHIRTVVCIFRIWTGVPDVVYLAGNFCFANRKKFCFLILQLCFRKLIIYDLLNFFSMHAYRILLPSETDDSRFNSREKHMLADSVQPYNKPIIDLACSVCTVKYQTSVWYFTVQTSRSVNKPLLSPCVQTHLQKTCMQHLYVAFLCLLKISLRKMFIKGKHKIPSYLNHMRLAQT
jgi:hypothetical protein